MITPENCHRTVKNLNLLLISKNKQSLADLEQALAKSGQHRVTCYSRPEEVYAAVTAGNIDGVIVDEEVEGGTGIEFIRELTPRNPFINCALVSSLYTDEFHEAIEGYGVFMQIPPHPGRKEAELICAHLARIC
jgi:DNA-binding NtrC family response regulator